MNKLGAQCQMRKGDLLEYCRIVRPKAAMGIMVQDRAFYQELFDLGVESVYRHWPNWWWNDPERHAKEAVAELKSETAKFRDLLAYVLDSNEYIYSFNEKEIPIADRFASSLIKEVHQELPGIHTIVLNLNTGHFRDDILKFPLTLAALNRCGKCKLGLHEYGWPTMYQQYLDGLQAGNDGMWHTLRWKVIMKAIRDAGFWNVRAAITECGIDGGVIPGQDNLGFLKVHQDRDEAIRNYKRSWAWYLDALGRDEDVDFALAYGCGLNDDWRGKGFDLAGSGIPEWIAGYKISPEVLND